VQNSNSRSSRNTFGYKPDWLSVSFGALFGAFAVTSAYFAGLSHKHAENLAFLEQRHLATSDEPARPLSDYYSQKGGLVSLFSDTASMASAKTTDPILNQTLKFIPARINNSYGEPTYSKQEGYDQLISEIQLRARAYENRMIRLFYEDSSHEQNSLRYNFILKNRDIFIASIIDEVVDHHIRYKSDRTEIDARSNFFVTDDKRHPYDIAATGSDDCDGFARLKQELGRDLGIPDNKNAIMFLGSIQSGHAVWVVQGSDGSSYVFDNNSEDSNIGKGQGVPISTYLEGEQLSESIIDVSTVTLVVPSQPHEFWMIGFQFPNGQTVDINSRIKSDGKTVDSFRPFFDL
jgi:hypothetical protein